MEQGIDIRQEVIASPEAERAVLGGIIIDNELITQAKRLLKVEDVYIPSNQKIFVAMLALHERDVAINPILVGEELKRHKQLESVGGISYITNLTYGLPHSTNITHYANIIRKYSKARWLLKFAARIDATIRDGEKDPDDIVKWILAEVAETDDRLSDLRRPKTIDQMYDDVALRFQLFHRGISDAVPTGFLDVDEKLLGGGLLPSLMYVLAGRPSMGKTTFALDVVCNAADTGHNCMIVSRETPAEMIIERMVSAKSGIDRFRISPGISASNLQGVMETLQSMRLVPIVLDDFSVSIDEIDHWLGEYERAGKRIELIMLDYLQLMSGDGDSRVQEVSGISKGYKGLLTKYKIPGILVSNLNRAGGSGEPELIHLRESGQIEFDADAVFMIHGDETEEDVEFLSKQLICKKQRDGPHFRRDLDMNTKLVTFRTKQMLGLSDGPKFIEPRRMKSDEEEVVQQKTRRKGPKSQDESFNF